MKDHKKSINPSIQIGKPRLKSPDYYIQGVLSGNRYKLSEAITLIEGTQEAQQKMSIEVLDKLYLQVPQKTIRIGITGSPGVGKSTFIESFGLFLVKKGLKVAVLAIDPSSRSSSGSILGDKTRMDQLSTHENAYVRPSPTGDHLGGIAYRTKEAVTLCEAAGYDIILIETVGVGQSETEVSNMTDIFMLLLLPGAGDEIQGIKRGVVELADILIINKADGERKTLALETQKAYRNALQLFTHKMEGWKPKLIQASALEKQGMEKAWNEVGNFVNHARKTGFIKSQRKQQNHHWVTNHVKSALFQTVMQKAEIMQIRKKLMKDLEEGKRSPFLVSRKLHEAIIDSQ